MTDGVYVRRWNWGVTGGLWMDWARPGAGDWVRPVQFLDWGELVRVVRHRRARTRRLSLVGLACDVQLDGALVALKRA